MFNIEKFGCLPVYFTCNYYQNLKKKILSATITNPVFPGRTTTDTMGEVAVGGEAG